MALAATRAGRLHPLMYKMWPNDVIAMVAVTLFVAIVLVAALLLARGF